MEIRQYGQLTIKRYPNGNVYYLISGALVVPFEGEDDLDYSLFWNLY